MNKRNRRQRKVSPKRSQGLSRISSGASVDNRLTHASMILSYLFKHGVDLQRRVISVTGEINSDTFDIVDRALTTMEAESRSTVTIKINSPGGYSYQAMAIVGRIQESKCKIITKGYGEVMSAASLILASGDERLISRHAVFMHHEQSYGLDYDRHSMLKDYVVQADKEQKQWATLMGELSKRPAKFWMEHGTKKDAYFTAQDLLKLGVVDEVF